MQDMVALLPPSPAPLPDPSTTTGSAQPVTAADPTALPTSPYQATRWDVVRLSRGVILLVDPRERPAVQLAQAIYSSYGRL